MSGGWKSRHEEDLIRIERESSVRGVRRTARAIHESHAGQPGRTWEQEEIQETVRDKKRQLRSVKSLVNNLNLPDW